MPKDPAPKDGWGPIPQDHPKPLFYYHDGKIVAQIKPEAGLWQPVAIGQTHLFHSPHSNIGMPLSTEDAARKVVDAWVAEAVENAAAAEAHLKAKADPKKPTPPPDEPVDSVTTVKKNPFA